MTKRILIVDDDIEIIRLLSTMMEIEGFETQNTLSGDEVEVGEKPHGFWLQEPYSSSYEENYRPHCRI